MRTIAVVDDNPVNRRLMNAILRKRYEVVEYEGGADGLEGMLSDPPDLVLLDISLPGMDGVAVLKEIRASTALRSLPVIALTAHALSGDRERFLAEGFDDYLSKPIVDISVVVDTIERLLAPSA